MGTYVVGISGASGACYGLRLLEELLAQDHRVFLLQTEAGQQVAEHELGAAWPAFLQAHAADPRLVCLDNDDLFAPIASGSFPVDGMVVAPCSMATLAEIASGTAKTLLLRAADVCLKERRPLILLPRETPLSAIHLENMLRAQRAGAVILAAMPGFYTHPASLSELVDTLVMRIFDQLELPCSIGRRWQEKKGKGEGRTS